MAVDVTSIVDLPTKARGMSAEKLIFNKDLGLYKNWGCPTLEFYIIRAPGDTQKMPRFGTRWGSATSTSDYHQPSPRAGCFDTAPETSLAPWLVTAGGKVQVLSDGAKGVIFSGSVEEHKNTWPRTWCGFLTISRAQPF